MYSFDSPLARSLELAMSLTVPPKVVNSAELPSPSGKSSTATKLLYSPLRVLYIYTFANKCSSDYFMGAISGPLGP